MKNFFFTFCIGFLLLIKQANGAEEGMPQLNPEYWIAQIFWLVLVFSSLYLIIWKIFLPRITSSLENRRLRIVNDLDEAQKLKENAEKKLKQYEEIIEKSKNEARKIVEDSRKKLNNDMENKKQKFNAEIEKELLIVDKEIKDLKKNSIENINKIAAVISSDLVKKIIESELNKSNVSAVVEDISKKRVEKYL